MATIVPCGSPPAARVWHGSAAGGSINFREDSPIAAVTQQSSRNSRHENPSRNRGQQHECRTHRVPTRTPRLRPRKPQLATIHRLRPKRQRRPPRRLSSRPRKPPTRNPPRKNLLRKNLLRKNLLRKNLASKNLPRKNLPKHRR